MRGSFAEAVVTLPGRRAFSKGKMWSWSGAIAIGLPFIDSLRGKEEGNARDQYLPVW